MENSKLSSSDVYSIVLEMLSGEKIVYIPSLKETIIFLAPTGKQKIYADFLEKQKLKDYLDEGYISESNISKEVQEEFFSTEDADKITELLSKVKSYEVLLRKRIKGTPQYNADLDKLNSLKKEHSLLFNKKQQVNQYTAEFKSREDKYLYLLTCCTFDLNRKIKFNNSNELDGISSLEGLYLILNEFLDFYLGYNNSVLRQIARHYVWRNYYLAASKNILNLFSKPTEDLSINQLELLAWSSWYQDIFEMSLKDRPAQDIIDDDESLDKYIEEYTKKIYAENEVVKDGGAAMGSQQVVVTAESKNYVKFKKANMYSDTSLVTGNKEGKTTSVEMKPGAK